MRDPSLDGLAREDEGRGWGDRGSRALASRCGRHPVSLHSCCRVSREMLGCRVVRPPPSKQTSVARLGSCGKRARWQQRSARGPRPEARVQAACGRRPWRARRAARVCAENRPDAGGKSVPGLRSSDGLRSSKPSFCVFSNRSHNL